MTLLFRCPPELVGRAAAARCRRSQGLPDWFKAMPQKAFNAVTQDERPDRQALPAFHRRHDLRLPDSAALRPQGRGRRVLAGTLDLPVNSVNNFMRSPIAFHDPSQVAGTPYHDDDRLLIKFNNFWTIEAPAGYSLLFTHPVNRPDLPFTTLTGLVDSDLYHDSIDCTFRRTGTT